MKSRCTDRQRLGSLNPLQGGRPVRPSAPNSNQPDIAVQHGQSCREIAQSASHSSWRKHRDGITHIDYEVESTVESGPVVSVQAAAKARVTTSARPRGAIFPVSLGNPLATLRLLILLVQDLVRNILSQSAFIIYVE